ncbi:response regulator [Halobacillus litoralis]|uniref:response regulator n=1 Tax=Halobacillus litoralis TaxID=45668 RepID=UPI001CD6F8F7|nr:response regulator [Halobacillus litoralis]MCA0971621.1 response regulator [Halobacillus litoralis]
MKRILVADDEDVLRMLITDTLEDEGYEIVEAEDGQQALSKIEKESFDLVILDYMMPEYTGIEVAAQLSDEWKQQTPLVMLTAKTQESDIQQSKDVGIHYFMAKPFSPLELIQMVEEILT